MRLRFQSNYLTLAQKYVTVIFFCFQMVSRVSFLLVCVFLGCAVAWQDEASEQLNSLQEILDRHSEQDIPVSLFFILSNVFVTIVTSGSIIIWLI